jgi:hypothetical protein
MIDRRVMVFEAKTGLYGVTGVHSKEARGMVQ